MDQQVMLCMMKERLAITDPKKDVILSDLLSESLSYLLLYTGRKTLPAALSFIALRLAIIAYQRLGMEGQTNHNEGGLSFSMEALPSDLKRVLDGYRVARFVQ